MPWSTEEFSKKVAEGTGDVKKNLEGLIETAEGVDAAFKKMEEQQQNALDVMSKFSDAMEKSSKALEVYGHSGVTAARGIRTVDTLSRSAASSLTDMGVGAELASDGFRRLSTDSSKFASDISAAQSSIAGLVTGLGDLDGRLKNISGMSVPLTLSVANMDVLDDLEARIGSLNKNVSLSSANVPVNLDVNSFDTLDDLDDRLKVLRDGIDVPINVGDEEITLPKMPKPQGKDALIPGNPMNTPAQDKTAGKGKGKRTAQSYMDEYKKVLKAGTTKMKRQLDVIKEQGASKPENRQQYVDLSVNVMGDEALLDLLSYLDPIQQGFFDTADSVEDVKKAIEKLIETDYEFATSIEFAKRRALEAAREETSALATLEKQVQAETKSLGDMYRKTFAQGQMEATKFADGLGGNATGMMAVGVAGAYLAEKLSDVARQFASAVVELSNYKVQTAATERVISGLSKGVLEDMRSQLDLTRDQAGAFFEVVKTGVNELGMSQATIMQVASALKATFGGDQTERLKTYVDLLKSIPSLDTDLKVTASMDDQTAAIFALADAGKMDIVMDMQTAGLMGGTQQKQEGADQLNAAQKTAATSEAMRDFLMNKMYPEWGSYLTEIVDWGGKAFGAVSATVGVLGALKTFLIGAHGQTLGGISAAASEISTAIVAKQNVPANIGKGGGAFGSGVKTLLKSVKPTTMAFGGLTIAAGLASYGLKKWSDNLETKGDEVGAAFASVGASTASIAGYAALGATLGSMVPVLGTALGAAAGAVYGFVSEWDNLKKSVPTLLDNWFGPGPAAKGDIEEESKARAARQNIKLVESGKALEIAMAKFKNTTESAKFKLLDMEGQVGSIHLENLADLGGSMNSYNRAIKGQINNSKRMYAEEMKVAADNRRSIMADAKMGAEQRKNMLMKVQEYELNAAKRFASEMDNVIEALHKSPASIQRGLKIDLSKQILDFGRDVGAFPEAKKAKIELEAIDLAFQGFTRSLDKGQEIVKMAAANMENLAKQVESAQQGINDAIIETEKKLGKERTTEATKQALEALKIAQKGVGGPDVEAAARKKKQDLEAKLAKNNAEMGVGKDNEALVYEGARIEKQIKEQVEIINREVEATLKVKQAQQVLNIELANRNALIKRQADLMSVMVNGKADIKLAEAKLDEAVKADKESDDAIAASKIAIGDNLKYSTALAATQIKEKIDAAAKELQKAQDAAEDAGKQKGTKGLQNQAIAAEAVKTAKKNFEDLQTQLSQTMTELSGQISAVAKYLSTDEISKIVTAMAGTKGTVEEFSKVWKQYGNANGDLLNSMRVSGKYEDQIAVEQEKKAQNSGVIASLQSLVDTQSGQTKLYETMNEELKRTIDKATTINDMLDQRWQQFASEIKDQERTIMALERSAVVAGLMGDSTQERAKLSKKEMKLAYDQYNQYMKSVDESEKMIRALKEKQSAAERIVKLEEDNLNKIDDKTSDAYIKQKGIFDFANKQLDAITVMVKKGEQRVAEQKQYASSIAKNMKKAGEQISDAMRNFDESIVGTRLTSWTKLSDVLLESADYSDNLAIAAKNSFEIAAVASEQRLASEKQIIKAEAAIRRQAIDEKIAMAKKEALARGDDEGTATAKGRLAGDLEMQVISEEERLALMTSETKQKRAVVEAAKRSKDLKERELNTQQELVDDAMSFASEFGGSFASIIELQGQSVNIARQQLDAATESRDRMVEAGIAGQELFEANADVAKKTLALRRQELGVQKSMMDRLLGSIFGQLREGFGGRKQVGTDQALLGRNATRMQTAAGVYVNVPGGKPGTIGERSLQRQMAGAGGQFSKEGGPGGFGGPGGQKATGFVGAVEAALKTTPAKSPLEAALAKATAETADNTKKIAEATQSAAKSLSDNGGGSIKSSVQGTAANTKTIEDLTKTSDMEGLGSNLSESLKKAKEDLKKGPYDQEKVDKISGIEKAIREREIVNPYAGAMGGDIAQTERIMSGTPLEIKPDMAGKALPEDTGPASMVAQRGITQGAGAMATTAAGTAVVPASSGVQAAAGVAGAGSEAASGQVYKLTGELTVKFDNAMFKRQVIDVVLQAITSPEFQRPIQTQAFAGR